METQCKRIIAYCEKHGSITSMEAFQYLGITRLSARVKDMRDAGIEVTDIWEEHVDEFDYKTRYKRYFIKEKEFKPDLRPKFEPF